MDNVVNHGKALVVFSGGQDSTTCLFWAKKRFKEVECISFNYNQRHKLELDCAAKICKEQGVKHQILDTSLINQLNPNSSLTRTDIAVEAAHDGNLPNSFVEGRNILFLTFAAIYAKVHGINHIITGVNATDFSGYPDCRDHFIKSLNVTLDLGMDFTFVIHTPLMWVTKAQTWEMADAMGALNYIRNETLTCYNGIVGDGCGTCPACTLRQKGLDEYLSHKSGK